MPAFRRDESPAELSVVVLSWGASSHVIEAIRSLHEPGVAVDVVLSHSGGGDVAGDVRRAFPSVRIVESRQRRLPGAARNVGVKASSAPYVAFLASDCVALPGWVTARIRRHRAGAAMVASAMVPGSRTPAAIAAYMLQHSGRMPHRPMTPQHRFGVSYARRVFDRHGLFPEDLHRGEDSVLNSRVLGAGEDIEWAPEVRTVHRYPTALDDLVRDQHRRSREGAIAQADRSLLFVLAEPFLRAAAGIVRALAPRSPLSRTEVMRALPWIVAAGLAGTAGAVQGAVAR